MYRFSCLKIKIDDNSKNIVKQESFKPRHHIPAISLILFKSLKTPLVIYITLAGNVIMFVSAYVFFYFEKAVNAAVSTYWDALWWALCTVSTVGYGDVVPITGAGRFVGAFLIIVGVMFFLGFTAVMVSVMSSYKTSLLK